MSLEAIIKSLENIEKNMSAEAAKAEAQQAQLGKVSADTRTALDNLGVQQRELADRLLQIEQKGSSVDGGQPANESWGTQFVKSSAFESFNRGSVQKARVEVKNTVVGAGSTVGAERKPDVVGGAFRRLQVEDMLISAPTTSNAVEYSRENTFVNNAAETAEGAAKPESSLTFTLVNEPVATVAHWIKISKQLAADAPALAAYISNRMKYGVNLRVENQIINGNGVAPNIAGFLKTGNFTAHGYTNANLGTVNKKFVLIRKVIADLAVSDYPADFIVLNPADWADFELTADSTGRYLVGNPADSAQPRLWGLPVVVSAAIAAGTFLVLSRMAATLYNREGVVVEMSDSDGDNFQRNLITLRAERRVMLAVEAPAAVRGGSLTPA